MRTSLARLGPEAGIWVPNDCSGEVSAAQRSCNLLRIPPPEGRLSAQRLGAVDFHGTGPATVDLLAQSTFGVAYENGPVAGCGGGPSTTLMRRVVLSTLGRVGMAGAGARFGRLARAVRIEIAKRRSLTETA